MKRIDQYIEYIYKNFNKSDKDVKQLKEEMKAHLYDKVQELKDKGLGEEESIEIAIKEFGPVVDVRNELSSIITRQKIFWKNLFICAAVIYLIGWGCKFGYNEYIDRVYEQNYKIIYAESSNGVTTDIEEVLGNTDNFDSETEAKVTKILDEFNSKNNNGIYYLSIEQNGKDVLVYNKEKEIPETEKHRSGGSSNIYDSNGTLKYKAHYKRTSSQSAKEYEMIKKFDDALEKSPLYKLESLSFVIFFISWIIFSIAFLGTIYSMRKIPKLFMSLVIIETCGLFYLFFEEHNFIVFMPMFSLGAIVFTGLIFGILYRSMKRKLDSVNL